MDLARLRTLRELSRRGTMAAVAEALFVSPSAVSQQIALLEQEAGTPLIERRGRGVRLTGAGARLAAQADRIFAILEETRTDLAAMRSEVTGEIRIGAFASVAVSLMPGVMRALEAAHPGLRVVVDVMEPDDGLAALRAWQVDAAVIDSFTLPSGFGQEAPDTVHVYDDILYAVLPAGHPLTGRETLSLTELASASWALDTTSSAYYAAVIAACADAGFEPAVNAYCTGFDVVAAMVAAGCSVSVMPGLLVTSFEAAFEFRRIVPEIGRRIHVALRRGERRKPALGALVAALEAAGRARPAAR